MSERFWLSWDGFWSISRNRSAVSWKHTSDTSADLTYWHTQQFWISCQTTAEHRQNIQQKHLLQSQSCFVKIWEKLLLFSRGKAVGEIITTNNSLIPTDDILLLTICNTCFDKNEPLSCKWSNSTKLRTQESRWAKLTWQHHRNLGSLMRACSVSFLWKSS